MKINKILILFILLLGNATPLYAALQDELHSIQKAWAKAKYQTPQEQSEKVFAQLIKQARALEKKYPKAAEPKAWLAIALSTDAGVNGGFSALSKVKEAKKLLEAAEKINPTALNGSIYVSLGSLYYQVPGWPIAFGNDEKARKYLQKALTINPDGIEPNYFYADFLISEDHPEEALKYLEKAKAAPPRPQRPIADAGRKKEVEAAIAKLRKKH